MDCAAELLINKGLALEADRWGEPYSDPSEMDSGGGIIGLALTRVTRNIHKNKSLGEGNIICSRYLEQNSEFLYTTEQGFGSLLKLLTAPRGLLPCPS